MTHSDESVQNGAEISVEATGETVGEAKWQALRELEKRRPGLDRARVRFQIVSEGERGLLGIGYSPAQVVATIEREEPPRQPPRPAAAPEAPEAPETELGAVVRELVERIVDGLSIDCRVQIRETEEEVVAACSGRDVAILIGRHGQTIDAVQYLVNAIVSRSRPDDRKDVTVDAAGYRDRRRSSLHALATRTAEQVIASGTPAELDPMTAVERKIVHVRLKDYPGVETASEGTEPNRYVVIRPAADAGDRPDAA